MIYFLLQLNITLVVGSLNCAFRASLFTFMMIVKQCYWQESSFVTHLNRRYT